MTYLFAANSFIFFVLFLIWTKRDWTNIFCKLVIFALFLSNFAFFLQYSGFITINP